LHKQKNAREGFRVLQIQLRVVNDADWSGDHHHANLSLLAPVWRAADMAAHTRRIFGWLPTIGIRGNANATDRMAKSMKLGLFLIEYRFLLCFMLPLFIPRSFQRNF
jgi:hypothetical protein